MIRTAWAVVNLLVGTVFLSILTLLALLFRAEDGAYDWLSRSWARWMIWASGTRIHVEGLEHIDPNRPQVIVSNHQSWYDVFALARVIPKRYRFVAKKELERIPIFGPAWKAAGHISIDRGDRLKAIQSLEKAGSTVRSDSSAVVIFPEGTRSPTGALLPFKKGAFMLAVYNKLDIVPAAVSGTHQILPKGGWRVRPGPINVRFGSPIPTEGVDESRRDEIVAEVRRRIEALLT